MAPSPKFTTVFLLILLTLSVQSHARQFFSKITSTNNIPKETTIPDTEQPESTFLPENQKQDNLPNNNQDQQQEPNFLPQAQTGYGLYGHESGLNTPETATERVTYAPYVTPITSGSFVDDKNNNNNNNYYNNNAFEEEQSQNLGANARFAETNNDGYRRTITKGNSYNSGNGDGYKTAVTNDDSYNNGDGYRRTITKGNNYNSGNGYKNDDSYNNGDDYRRTISNDGGNYYNGKTVGNDGGNYYNGKTVGNDGGNYYNGKTVGNDGGNYYNNDGNRKTVTKDGGNYYNGNGYRNNVERQGMSDTRFMENGKYFYDVENEQNYFQNRNQFQNNRVNMRNENAYSTNGAGFYGNGNVNGQKYESQEDVEEFEP